MPRDPRRHGLRRLDLRHVPDAREHQQPPPTTLRGPHRQPGRHEPVAVPPDHQRRHPEPGGHRPQRLAAPPAAQHRLGRPVERLARPGLADCARRTRPSARPGAARWRGRGRRSRARPRSRRARRLVIAASPSRARRPAGPGSMATIIRGSDTRRGSGLQSGIAGETSVSDRTSSGRRAATMMRDRAAEGVAEQVHGTAAPGEEAQQRVGVPGRACSRATRQRPGKPNPGRSTADAGRPGREQAREVGPVRGRAGEPVHVDGLGVSAPGVSRTCRVTPPAVISRPGHGGRLGSRRRRAWPGRRAAGGRRGVAGACHERDERADGERRQRITVRA